jgi:hypothetical protein
MREVKSTLSGKGLSAYVPPFTYSWPFLPLHANRLEGPFGAIFLAKRGRHCILDFGLMPIEALSWSLNADFMREKSATFF